MCPILLPIPPTNANELVAHLRIPDAFLRAQASPTGGATQFTRALRHHPHFELWSGLGALVKDGCSLSAARLGLKPSSSNSSRGPLQTSLVPPTASNHPPDRRGSSISVSSRDSGKSKSKNRSSRRGKRSKRSNQAKTSKRDKDEEVTHAVATAPTPTLAKEWQPTRTGLLAVGARETGVKCLA